MPEIPLTQGQVAIVDEIDYEYLMQFKWFARRGRLSPPDYRAVRNTPRGANGKRGTASIHREVARRAGTLGPIIDHIDRDTLNNRRSNLRPATNSQNLHNRGRDRNNTSGYAGVSYIKASGKYRAYVYDMGKQIYLGTFDDPAEAAKVRNKAKRKIAGEFAPKDIKDA